MFPRTWLLHRDSDVFWDYVIEQLRRVEPLGKTMKIHHF
jgi:hypothetical protein